MEDSKSELAAAVDALVDALYIREELVEAFIQLWMFALDHVDLYYELLECEGEEQ